jgi:two-component system LytT family sensor kinase
MKILAVSQILKRSKLWPHRRWIGHSVFWLVFLTVIILLDLSNTGWPIVLYNKLVDISFYAMIVYVNLLWLIPNYLTSKKFGIYVGLLLLAVLILTPIKILIQILLLSGEPGLQVSYLRDQSYYFLSMFLVGSSSTLYNIMVEWFRHQSEKLELKTQTMQSELKFLRSQINPHFLFNTLNNLYALTLKKSDDAPEIVLKLSEMMRYMLYECNERRVPLSKEIAYMRNYIDNQVDINMNIDGDVYNQTIAPLLLIPFIENSFKHGLNSQIKHGYVNIDLVLTNDHLNFTIKNSKRSNEPRINYKKSGGIGLVNVKRRLNLIYPDQYNLKIKNEPNNYTVTLDLKL